MTMDAPRPAPDFQALYGRPPEITASAPGRVNLIGEHTDYNGGFVLPVALPRRTTVELARRADRQVLAWSADLDLPGGPLGYRLGEEAPGRGWLDYLQGVTWALREGGHERGISGFEARIASEVPLGSGLSSSAALEVALLRALRRAFGLSLSDAQLALLGQRAENGLVGAAVGIMDQMAASLASEGEALFLDTRSLAFERLPLPAGAELGVIDSGVPHSNIGGGYAERRAQCEEAAERLGVPLLRDLSPADLPALRRLPEPLARRARHVITENDRVLQAVAALRRGDLPGLGALLRASHRSLKEDFEVSLPELDLLVALAGAEPGVYGARLCGAGLGGAVVLLARRGQCLAAAERVAAAYARRSGRRAAVLLPLALQQGRRHPGRGEEEEEDGR